MSDMESLREDIVRNLNAITGYQCDSRSLDALKRALRGLCEQLEEAMKTKEGMGRWQRELETALHAAGQAEYTRGDPHEGGRAELVRTPENMMRAFVREKGKLCTQAAARIVAQRDKEERQAMPTIEETQKLVHAFCVCVEALSKWKEISGLEQKYSGRRLFHTAELVQKADVFIASLDEHHKRAIERYNRCLQQWVRVI